MNLRFTLLAILSASLISVYSLSFGNDTPLPLKLTYDDLGKTSQAEINCLAQNMYFESASEPKEGQIAVALVTFNRMNNDNYPNTVCGVVNQKINGVCQFSWRCDPKAIEKQKRLTRESNSLYNEIHELATRVYINQDSIEDVTRGALFYHADYIKPTWNNMKTTRKIGRHIFYVKISRTKHG
jgi:spore germination cell wall hydrolase CwlJ-like protein